MRRISTIALLLMAMFAISASAQNPFLPLWEYIPDGEPYVFEDPDKPGHFRVYVYGSHDSEITQYCGFEQVVWSAPVENLRDWRYDGVTLKVTHGADGRQLHENGRGDMLYAPDMAVRNETDGTKTYFLYPNDQEGGRQGLVAKSKRPDGPFEVINWNPEKPNETIGDLRFDPAVFIDDDGKVYGYWGFEQSFAAELDPVTMATIKPGTLVENHVPSNKQDELYRFFEASSMRKIEDKYVFIYSRWTREGEFGLPSSNYTLAYAYGDSPLGPFTYGGTIIDGRARATDPVTGKTIPTAHPGGNTHGSIFEANGQWWVVYHRQTGYDEFSRQAMAAPITVKVEKGRGGKVTISEGEYTSEGFAIEGLNPLERTTAGIACYYTGPSPITSAYPKFFFSGSHIFPTRIDQSSMQWPYSYKMPISPVVNNTAGSVVGYKYFDFKKLGAEGLLTLNILPQGVDGTIKVMIGNPDERFGGKQIGEIQLRGDMPQKATSVSCAVSGIPAKKGKQALFFVFTSDTKEKSLCEFYDFIFSKK
ncbi:MAG: family 43 glycosylhydrolase [Prevotellaceae bacterium]|nr:family 43 glycosylhydrolase [Prevotellaceae bacterium]